MLPLRDRPGSKREEKGNCTMPQEVHATLLRCQPLLSIYRRLDEGALNRAVAKLPFGRDR